MLMPDTALERRGWASCPHFVTGCWLVLWSSRLAKCTPRLEWRRVRSQRLARLRPPGALLPQAHLGAHYPASLLLQVENSAKPTRAMGWALHIPPDSAAGRT